MLIKKFTYPSIFQIHFPYLLNFSYFLFSGYSCGIIFCPILTNPFKAPSPLGKDIEGKSKALDFVALFLELIQS